MSETVLYLQGLGQPDGSETLEPPATPPAQVTPPVIAMQQFLASWLSAARAQPEEPASTAILVMSERAIRRPAPIDLSNTQYDPAYRLEPVDLMMLAQGIAHLAPILLQRSDQKPTAATTKSLQLATPAILPAAGSKPCSDMKTTLDAIFFKLGTVAQSAASKYTSKAIDAMYQALLSYYTSDPRLAGTAALATQGFKQFLKALNLISRVLAVVSVYKLVSARVELDGSNPIHKATEKERERIQLMKYVAEIPDKEFDNPPSSAAAAWQDCMKFIGLPMPSTAADAAKLMQQGRVKWRISQGVEHAAFAPLAKSGEPGNVFDFPGQLASVVKAVGDRRATSEALVQIGQEASKDHPGDEQSAPVTVRGSLTFDTPPNPLLLYGAAKAGVSPFGVLQATIPLLIGLFENLNPITAEAAFNVTYHSPHPGSWRGTAHVSIIETQREAKRQVNIGSVVQTMSTSTTQISGDLWLRTAEVSEEQGVLNIFGVASGWTAFGVISTHESRETKEPTRWCTPIRTETSSTAGGGTTTDDGSLHLVHGPDGSYGLEIALPPVSGQLAHHISTRYSGCEQPGVSDQYENEFSEFPQPIRVKGRTPAGDDPTQISGSATVPYGSNGTASVTYSFSKIR